jgi:hypothetical protein
MQKTLIRPDRVREIPREGFSWLDRRLILKNFLLYLSEAEFKLYFFLCLVGDSQGLSYYGWRRICRVLHLSEGELREAIEGLQEQDLIAHRWPLFQVLSLPERPVVNRARVARMLEDAQ